DRRARERLREAGHAGGVDGAAADDLDGLGGGRGGRVLRMRGTRQREHRGRRERRAGTGGTGYRSHRALSKRWQGNGVGKRGTNGPGSATASLREDYLSQVQRDFLSRALHTNVRPNTPSEGATPWKRTLRRWRLRQVGMAWRDDTHQ